jgi:hypothetical protein
MIMRNRKPMLFRRPDFGVRALLAAVAFAAAVPAAAAPDAARMAAAERMLDATDYDATVARTVDAMIVEQQRQFRARLEQQTGRAVPDELANRLFAEIEVAIRSAMARHRKRVREGTALIYANRFTAAELDRLAALQSDPVMVRMRKELPGIMTESMMLSRAMLESELPAMKQRIEAVVLDYMRTHGGGAKPPES